MDDRVGKRFEEYLLIRRLGRGSFGNVYLGRHVRDSSLVAIKILTTYLKDDADPKELVKRLKEFINEASAFNLKHPNIAELLAFGVAKDGAPFLVIDYAPLGSLRGHIPEGTTLSLADVVKYVKQIAAALQYAHDHHRIHRDVKPENILLKSNDDILLSDFGIATFVHSTGTWEEQKMAGTYPYMAPEQIMKKAQPASDQYALSIIVYEWLCGRRPFEGDEVQLIHQHLYVEPPSLRERIPIISAEVEHVITTALAKDPKHRFASVRAFANALEQAVKAPTINSIVEQKRGGRIQTQAEALSSVLEVDETPVFSVAPSPSPNIVESPVEKKIIGLDEPSIAPGRMDKLDAKSVAVANLQAPLKSIDGPMLPLPPFVAPVFPLNVPPPIVAVPSSDDNSPVKPLLTMLPQEQIVVTENNILTPEQRAIQQDNYRRLYSAIEQLVPAQRQLLQLRYGNGMRLVAIAELLAKPESSIREMLAYTLRQLRTIYEKTEGGMK